MCQHSKATLNCNCWKGFLKSLLYAGIHSPFAVWSFTPCTTFRMGYAAASAAVSDFQVGGSCPLLQGKVTSFSFAFSSVVRSSISFPLLCAGQQSGQELLSSLTAFVFRGFVAANSAIQRLWRQRPWYLVLKLLCSSFTESPVALGAVIPGPHPSGHSWFSEIHFLSLQVISCMRWKVWNLLSAFLWKRFCRPVIPITDIFLWATSTSATSFWQERNWAVCLELCVFHL